MFPIVNPLPANIRRTIAEHGMFVPGDKVLVGTSGGPDSMALVHLLGALTDELDITIGLGYLNHGLRPAAAEKEAAFVQTTAADLNLECHQGSVRIDRHSGSIEEQARTARYEFFRRIAEAHGYTKTAVAHHAGDNAEVVLMHLLRGSGLRGLAGIPPVGPGGIVRPLISCRRSDIMAYLEDNGFPYMTDESNADCRFTRNKIRHQLIPFLEKHYHPEVVQTLNRTAELCRQEEQWLQQYSMALLPEVRTHSDEHGFGLRTDRLVQLALPIQRRLIREALRNRQGHIRRLTSRHVDAVLALAVSQRYGRRLHLPMGMRVERTADALVFSTSTHPRSAGRTAPPPAFCYSIASSARLPLILRIPEADCRLQFSTIARYPPPKAAGAETRMVLFDLDRLHFPLIVRNVRAGDRIQPFGMAGTQKIKDLLINRKIPAPLRPRMPLLISGSDIIWVVGLRRGAPAPVSSTTDRVLRIEVLMAADTGSPPGC